MHRRWLIFTASVSPAPVFRGVPDAMGNGGPEYTAGRDGGLTSFLLALAADVQNLCWRVRHP